MNDNIFIENQNLIKIKGAKKMLNCTNNLAIIQLEKNNLSVQGANLEMKKLDLENNEVIICGTISNIKFANEKQKQSLIKRIFK